LRRFFSFFWWKCFRKK